MHNQDIRQEIVKARLKYWQVAEALGINDGNFSRKLRRELSAQEKERIRKAILKAQGGEQDAG